MPRTPKTLIFNDPADNIQITAHKLRSSTDMSLNIETSKNLYVTSDNFVLNASDLSTNTIKLQQLYINDVSLSSYIKQQAGDSTSLISNGEDASLNNVDISGDLTLTNENKTFTVAGHTDFNNDVSINGSVLDISGINLYNRSDALAIGAPGIALLNQYENRYNNVNFIYNSTTTDICYGEFGYDSSNNSFYFHNTYYNFSNELPTELTTNLSVGSIFATDATSTLHSLNVNGATTLSSTLGVTNAVTLSSTLDVAGASTLQDLSAGATDISSTLNVTGATTLLSTLDVAGASTLQDLSAGATDISSTLSVTGATTLSSTLAVTNAATFSNSIEVTSDSSFNSSLYVNSNLTVSNQLIIGDSSSRGGRIYSGEQNNNIIIDPYAIDSNEGTDASGAVYIYGDLYVKGNTVSISSTEITLDDMDLYLAPNVSDSTLLNGAGILVGTNNIATLRYNSVNNVWKTNIGLDVSGALTSSGAISGNIITALTNFIGDISSGGTSTFTTVDINGGAIDGTTIGSTSASTGAFTTINASSNVTFSQNLDVSGLDVSNNATVGGTLGVTGATTMTSATLSSTIGVTGKLTASGGIEVSGNVLPTTTSSHIPVTHNTFSLINSGINSDLTGISTGWSDANGFDISKTLLSANSFVKMEFKANFISSPEADQTLSFRVQRSTDSGSTFDTIFTDSSLGSNMGVTIRNVYNGTYIDDPGSKNVRYKLQYNRDGSDIDTSFGIVSGGNYIFLQELYVPSS
jgi:hypothetical protein